MNGERKPQERHNQNKQEKNQNVHIKRKTPNRARLCADDVMARNKLTEYQDSYGEAMAKYGLKRGIKGSDARHITTAEHYRNQMLESQNLQINIDNLLAMEESKRLVIDGLKQKELEAKQATKQAEEARQQKESELRKTKENLNQVKGKLNTEKFKNSAAKAGSAFMDGISSALGTSKVKRQQQEIENLIAKNENLIHEVNSLKQNIQTIQTEHKTALDKLKDELKRIHKLFPNLKELLWIEKLLIAMRFSENLIKSILTMNPVGFKGRIYSSEYQRYFETEHSVAEIKATSKGERKLQLTIDGVSHINWFKQKHKELQQNIGIRIKEPKRGRSML